MSILVNGTPKPYALGAKSQAQQYRLIEPIAKCVPQNLSLIASYDLTSLSFIHNSDMMHDGRSGTPLYWALARLEPGKSVELAVAKVFFKVKVGHNIIEVDLTLPRNANVIRKLERTSQGRTATAVFEFIPGDNCHSIIRWLLTRSIEEMTLFLTEYLKQVAAGLHALPRARPRLPAGAG